MRDLNVARRVRRPGVGTGGGKVGSGGAIDTRSWVAKKEPRNRA